MCSVLPRVLIWRCLSDLMLTSECLRVESVGQSLFAHPCSLESLLGIACCSVSAFIRQMASCLSAKCWCVQLQVTILMPFRCQQQHWLLWHRGKCPGSKPGLTTNKQLSLAELNRQMCSCCVWSLLAQACSCPSVSNTGGCVHIVEMLLCTVPCIIAALQSCLKVTLCVAGALHSSCLNTPGSAQ